MAVYPSFCGVSLPSNFIIAYHYDYSFNPTEVVSNMEFSAALLIIQLSDHGTDKVDAEILSNGPAMKMTDLVNSSYRWLFLH